MSCPYWSVRCHLNKPQRWLPPQESSLSHTLTAVSISVTLRKHYGRHVCKFISHFHLFSLSFQCHMQSRPAAADAGLSAGAINTHRRGTKYRPRTEPQLVMQKPVVRNSQQRYRSINTHRDQEIWEPVQMGHTFWALISGLGESQNCGIVSYLICELHFDSAMTKSGCL